MKRKYTIPRKAENPNKGILELVADMLNGKKVTLPIFDGFSLDKHLKGEILEFILAPNESKVIPHGLRAIPLYRIILRQTGNAVITDEDAEWTDKTVGFKNNSAVSVELTIKLLLG